MSKSTYELLTYEERAAHAQRIKALRLARGLTQDDLGVEAGVSRATINNWENGATVPQADKLEVVFRALGVQLDESEFEPATQEWLTVMGVLVERIPAADRQPVMNNAITVVARGNVVVGNFGVRGPRHDLETAPLDSTKLAASKDNTPVDPTRGEK